MEQRTIRPAPVRRTLTVAAEADKAFKVFTDRMASWWPSTHSIGSAPFKEIILEPRAGGRWFERGTDGAECEWGHVLAFDPPRRLLLAWQLGADWKYDPNLITEVEITFTPVGETETRVELEHRNLERYGEATQRVREAVGGDRGWATVLACFAEAASIR
ncbi:MAG TPA: SRPBCC family protein [Xanthobacteraceae bacterium]|nr:SRPBCC family protein [Xanthobacteraceae bacterium]